MPEQWFFVSEIPAARRKIGRDVVRRLTLKERAAESPGRGAKMSEPVEKAKS